MIKALEKRSRKILNRFWLVFFLALLVLSAVAVSLYSASRDKGARVEEQSRIVKVEPHSGLMQIARILQQEGIIRSPWPFVVAAFLSGSATQLKAGEYAFTPGMSFLEILGKMERGEIFHYKVTFPEGFTIREVAEQLHSQGLADRERFLRLCHDREILRRYGMESHSLEGYLFPDTYFLVKGMQEEEILDRMVLRFLQAFTPAQERRARQLAMSRHQAVTLASLIEAETPRGDERFLVSSVFHRRLKIRMPLQCDPTVIYALWKERGERKRLARRDLSFRSAYNTYIHPGLPPGPICNPGTASIEAALEPAASPYLYFVSRGNGSHHFSSTWAEHSRAVRRYQSL